MNPSGYILNLAGTGLVPTRAMSPHVPLSHTEIVDDVAACLELGVQMVHLHARTQAQRHTGDPEPYGRLIEAIRKLPGGRNAILCVTTSGRDQNDFESRSRVLDLDGAMKPDMASLTLSSLNFVQQASVNEPDTIRKLAQRMLDRGIRPELEIFDLGMANFLQVLEKEGLIKAPHYANLLLGNIAGAQPTAAHLAALQSSLPRNSISVVAGIGRTQLAANTLGLVLADGARIGLEDNLWLDSVREKPASNPMLVKRIKRIAGELDCMMATREQVRTLLGFSSGHMLKTP